jgi:DNA polymerase I-like protein with 3'-5' exonuclease and polymerase domains
MHLRDFHGIMAQRASPSNHAISKKQWKGALYGLAYGQTEAGFIRSHTEMSIADATTVFSSVSKLLADTMVQRKRFKKKFYPRTTRVITAGGWQRRPATWTRGFNTHIQGWAADIFRYVLRRLHTELKPFGAFLVHQAHDEVFVACPKGTAAAVAAVVRRVMEQDVLQTQLRPGAIPLFASVTTRTTWAEGT